MFSPLCSSLCPSASASVNDYLHSLQAALSIFVAHLSEKNWKLALDWLKTLVTQKKGVASKSLPGQVPDEQESREEGLAQLLQAAETCLDTLFQGGAVRELHDSERKLCRGDSFGKL